MDIDGKTMARVQGYFANRWHSRIGLPVLLWRDMFAVGTLINLLASFAALALLAEGVDARWAAIVYFAPVPYNAFLLACAWRSPYRTRVVVIAAGLWFGVMAVV